MAAAEAEIANVGDALESLVHQFSDPWAFLRELIQNSIDAGSDRIEVRIDHDQAHGTMVVEVVDSGEGMTREIIDSRLTRLFSSSKEGDYTKIGRFGIGFVSVFAIDPDLVCVDTGRSGEWWRVVFKRDRSFERIKLSSPVEGTTVRLYKAADEAAVEEARLEARRTLEYWCKHARIELRLDDELISQPFAIGGLCEVEQREDETTVVMALVEGANALRGYYHAGLTLHEEHDDSLPHIAFKVDSRFLEHTLTRDNVIRDENFAKAMAIVGEVARTRLIAKLFEELEQLAQGGGGMPSERALLYRAAKAAAKQGQASWLERRVIPMLGEPAASLADLRKRRRSLLYRARRNSPLVERVRSQGHKVVNCSAQDEIEELIASVLDERPRDLASLCLPIPIDELERPRWEPLRLAIVDLLERVDEWKVSEVALAHFDQPDSSIAGRVAITQARLGEPTPLDETNEMASGWLTSGRALVFAVDHPTIVHLARLATTEPEFAAYLALKAFMLAAPLAPERDQAISRVAMEARWRRNQG